jgi:hypothetical protein
MRQLTETRIATATSVPSTVVSASFDVVIETKGKPLSVAEAFPWAGRLRTVVTLGVLDPSEALVCSPLQGLIFTDPWEVV